MMTEKTLSRPEKWILAGIPALFAIGSGMHFLYQLLGESPIVGAFAPVNESIWEHEKLLVLPLILWWLLYERIHGRQREIEKHRWYAGALSALLAALAAMPFFYYFYTSAFGAEFVWADVLILLAALFLGQLLGLHIVRRSRGMHPAFVLTLFLLILLAFALLTFFPPHIPLFRDHMTGGYGICGF